VLEPCWEPPERASFITPPVRRVGIAAHRPGAPTRRRPPGGMFRGPPGYKTRVFTGAICPVPHETETVVSKGAST
jgi:hypothetical protein